VYACLAVAATRGPGASALKKLFRGLYSFEVLNMFVGQVTERVDWVLRESLNICAGILSVTILNGIDGLMINLLFPINCILLS
jgi:hypothetical protein